MQTRSLPKFPEKSAFAGFSLSAAFERTNQLNKYFVALSLLPLASTLLVRDFFDSLDGTLLYATMSLCPVCAVRERHIVRW